ncbi:MAG: hypothetical protein ABSH41_32235 [Syntrophobacteraceae bacterium]
MHDRKRGDYEKKKSCPQLLEAPGPGRMAMLEGTGTFSGIRVYMTELINDPCDKDLTDEQSFRQIVETFAASRSDTEGRKFIRFPTASALSGKLGLQGFQGYLVVEEANSSNESGRDGDGEFKQRPCREKIGINAVDFSEDGIQLQLRCNDFFGLQKRSLSLEILNRRIPVRLTWWQQAGFEGRGGFQIVNRIDFDPFLVQFISKLNTHLIDFLITKYLKEPTSFTKQAGIFIYISIYYGLRLKFLEAVSNRNSSIQSKEGNGTFNISEHQGDMHSLEYYHLYHWDQFINNELTSGLRFILSEYIKPFHTFGCAIIGMNHDIAILSQEAHFTIFNSVLLIQDASNDSTNILPEIYNLYNKFILLKSRLMPGVFDADIFEIQFRRYSSLIMRISGNDNIGTHHNSINEQMNIAQVSDLSDLSSQNA